MLSIRSFATLSVVALALGVSTGCYAMRKQAGRPAAGEVVRALSDLYSGDACAAWSKQGTQLTWQFDFDGTTYNVPIRTPQGTGRRQAVILLHGGGGDGGPAFLRSTGYGAEVDGKNVLLLSPSSDRYWSSGKTADGPRDDVAFLDAMTKRIKREACVDEVMAVGFSAGAAIANRWICEGDSPPDMLVSAAGTLMVPKNRCDGTPEAIRLYVGTEDPRYRQGATEGEPSVPDTAEIWAGINKCSSSTHEQRLSPDTMCTVWEDCAAPVELCIIDQFGHAYPKGPSGSAPCQHNATVASYNWFTEVVGR